MYLDMLGYQTYFGQVEVLKLLAMPGFPGKFVDFFWTRFRLKFLFLRKTCWLFGPHATSK